MQRREFMKTTAAASAGLSQAGVLSSKNTDVYYDKLDDATFDYVIYNNGTIEELVNKVKEILIDEKIIKS